MTDNDIWSERYTNDKYGLEQKSSFNYFQEYLKEPKPRNLKEFHKKLSEILSEKGKQKLPTYKTLCDYSHKWKWNKRAEAYDSYIQNKDDEELKEKFKEIKKANIERTGLRLKLQDELLEQIQNDDELTTKDKIYASARNSEAYNNEIRSLTELYNDGKDIQEIEADLQTNSILEVEPKSVFDEIQELDKELESIYEDNETKPGKDK